jgi:Flp pilus assembly protein TadD
MTINAAKSLSMWLHMSKNFYHSPSLLKRGQKITLSQWNNCNLLFALGCHEEVVDTFEHCISLDPDDAEEWRFLGCVFSRLGQDEKAGQAYRRAEEIDPNREDVWGQRTASLVC